MNQYSRPETCPRRHAPAFRVDRRGWRTCRVCDAERNKANRAARRGTADSHHLRMAGKAVLGVSGSAVPPRVAAREPGRLVPVLHQGAIPPGAEPVGACAL